MSRYIDADLLKQCVQNNITRYYTCGTGGYCLAEDVVEDIDNFPTANVVEVVRCKDCKWWTKEKIGSQGRCGMLGHYPRDVFYCSHGERKEK